MPNERKTTSLTGAALPDDSPALVFGGQGRECEDLVFEAKVTGLIFLAGATILIFASLVVFSQM